RSVAWGSERGLVPVGAEGDDEVPVAGEFGRLLDVAIRPGLIGGEDVFLAPGGGQDDDGDGLEEAVVLDLGEDLGAVDPGEIEVEQDEVGLSVGGDGRVMEPLEIIEGTLAIMDDGQAMLDIGLAKGSL